MLCSKCNESAEGLTDAGLCPDCHMQSEDRRVEILELAREQREVEGQLEIDGNALLSEGNENGCYVQSWVWVDFAGTKFDKEKEADEPSPTKA